jgi:hypothetical protein
MIRPQHIALKERKALAAGLICLPPLNPPPSQLTQAMYALDALDSKLHEKISEVLEKKPGEALPEAQQNQLDRFLKDLLNCLKEQAAVSTQQGGARALAVSDAIAKIDAGVFGICCQTCAVDPERVCKGTSVDDDSKVVAERGQCIQVIKHMFDVAEAATRTYYTRFSTAFQSVDSNFPVVFSTEDCGTKPHEFSVPFQVSGQTVLDEIEGTRSSRVVLKLWVEQFDWETYLACPYVFFHEFICHVFSDTIGAAYFPRQGKTSDPFREGWMDWISALGLKECFNGSVAGIKCGPDLGQSRIAEEYRVGRIDFRPRYATRFANLWAVGGEAAQKVRDLLLQLTETAEEARSNLFQISFDLNLGVCSWSASDRAQFVMLLAEYLPYATELPNPIS